METASHNPRIAITTHCYPAGLTKGVISFTSLSAFWVAYLALYLVAANYPDYSEVGLFIVFFVPLLFVGIGYGLVALIEWIASYKKGQAPCVSWHMGLGLLLILPAILNSVLLVTLSLF